MIIISYIRMQNLTNYLLRIKKGAFQYDELVAIADTKIASINDAYERSDLPDQPDIDELNKVLIEIRREFYKIV